MERNLVNYTFLNQCSVLLISCDVFTPNNAGNTLLIVSLSARYMGVFFIHIVAFFAIFFYCIMFNIVIFDCDMSRVYSEMITMMMILMMTVVIMDTHDNCVMCSNNGLP